ncbi:hypothetical protein MRBLMI12_000494 [Microbacterium sp. LMI12-1-1.1]|uniref:hypothetical protein n=1 Tax=Microbacterium sp. LMI12-1-1.1 TaxID=3135225 RepID=UPI00341AF45D
MAESTQSAHPWRASFRTGIAVAPVVLAGAAAAGEEIAKFVAEQFPGTSAAAVALSVSAFAVGLSILVNRLMLTEKVAAALEAIGLGPKPKGDAS